MDAVTIEHRFGGIDADADDLLATCFRDHPAYVEAREHRRFLIVGRKGSGKTAIYKKLITETSFDHFAFGHSFEDYPWHHHDLQAQTGIPEERRYINSWAYLIEISLARILLNQDNSQPWDDDSMDNLAQLSQFIVDSYGTLAPDIRQLFSPARKLRLRGKLKAKLFEVEGETVSLTDLPKHIQEVNANIASAVIDSLNPSMRYYVCFDQLDLGFEPGNRMYHDRLVGLVLAARRLNQLAKDRGKRLTVAVFLRDDIYEMLRFEDKNKTTESDLISVYWSDRSEPGSLTLRELMERRFSEVFSPGSERVPWNTVFDESKQMPGRQEKYQHICDRTFLRPRDMIKFCNEVAAAHERRGNTERLFQNEDLSDARDHYSRYLLKELEDEIHKHIPMYDRYLDILRKIGSLQFKRERFEEYFARDSELGSSNLKSGDALRELFEFSVVGIVKSGGEAGGSRILWKYRDSRAQFQSDVETLRVHAGFKEALELTQGER